MIRYAESGGVSIAYEVVGDGPLTLVYAHGFVSNLELERQEPRAAAFLDRLAEIGRLVTFDRRGTGLSDRVREPPPLETRMDDLRAVMDAAGLERAALFGTHEAASMCAVFAATYPERVAALCLYNPTVCGIAEDGFPWAPTEDEWRETLAEVRRAWGTEAWVRRWLEEAAPSFVDDELVAHFAQLHRLSASPGAAASIFRMQMDVDIRALLPSIRVPTLVLGHPIAREEARFAADRIPGARRVEVEGDYMIVLRPSVVDEVEQFVREAWGEAEPDTVLATVLFTDIVGSTERAAELGDRRWAELVSRHHASVRAQLDRFRGRELDTAGDGFFAAFDGPLRAIRCARAISSTVRDLGLEVRAGLHTGECEQIGEKLGGLAVNIGARVAAHAGPGEVLVSRTVRDLVAGSDIVFDARGPAALKGVPGEWELYAVRQ